MTNDLNHSEHILNKIINSENEKLALKVFYIKHCSEPDKKYTSIEITLNADLMVWYKNNIKKELNNLKIKDESNESTSFHYHKYNNEFDRRDSLSIIDVNEMGNPLKNTLNDLIESTVMNRGILKGSKFSLVKIEIDNNNCFLGYYKGITKSGGKKKYCLGKIESNDFTELDRPMIEIGGKPDFIIHNQYIYVVNPRYFEYAFKYTDHITLKRDENLSRIINMDFFDDPIAKDCFYQKSRGYLRARSIAQISDETFMVLEENFNERCDELNNIKQEIEHNPELLEEIKEKSSIILELMDYIDLDNKTIIFDEESDPTPLLHFFKDKIMESFLTKNVRIAMSI